MTCPVCGRRVRISKGVLVKHRTYGSVCPNSGAEVQREPPAAHP